MKIKWIKTEIKHNPQPKYLGVKLDRNLQFKTHCEKVRSKIANSCNVLGRPGDSS